MHKYFDAADWYWQAFDGRLFSSSRAALVESNDAEYRKFVAAGGQPTAWPKDDDGEQTDAALLEVLEPYGLTLEPPADL